MASSAVVEPRCVVNRFRLSLGHDGNQMSLKGLSGACSMLRLSIVSSTVPLTWLGALYRPLQLYKGPALRALRGLDRVSVPDPKSPCQVR